MNSDKTVNARFIDASPYNIHLLWEPLMELWTQKFSTLDINVSPDRLMDLSSSGEAYKKSKQREQQGVSHHEHTHGPLAALVLYLERREAEEVEKGKVAADRLMPPPPGAWIPGSAPVETTATASSRIKKRQRQDSDSDEEEAVCTHKPRAGIMGSSKSQKPSPQHQQHGDLQAAKAGVRGAYESKGKFSISKPSRPSGSAGGGHSR